MPERTAIDDRVIPGCFFCTVAFRPTSNRQYNTLLNEEQIEFSVRTSFASRIAAAGEPSTGFGSRSNYEGNLRCSPEIKSADEIVLLYPATSYVEMARANCQYLPPNNGCNCLS